MKTTEIQSTATLSNIRDSNMVKVRLADGAGEWICPYYSVGSRIADRYGAKESDLVRDMSGDYSRELVWLCAADAEDDDGRKSIAEVRRAR